MRSVILLCILIAAGLASGLGVAERAMGTAGAQSSEAGPEQPIEPEKVVAEAWVPVAPLKDTNIQIVIERIVSDTYMRRIGDELVTISQDEAVMLDELDLADDQWGATEALSVWFTLSNLDDTGYLVCNNSLQHLLRSGIGFADVEGRRWKTFTTVLFQADGHVPGDFTIPLAPRGRRSMHRAIAYVDFEPPWQLAKDTPVPERLGYRMWEQLRAEVIPGDPDAPRVEIDVRAGGQGVCEISPGWPAMDSRP
ncbi:MAG: hypothetical protein ACFCBV_06150 [Phycisphaerales bacterium]